MLENAGKMCEKVLEFVLINWWQPVYNMSGGVVTRRVCVCVCVLQAWGGAHSEWKWVGVGDGTDEGSTGERWVCESTQEKRWKTDSQSDVKVWTKGPSVHSCAAVLYCTPLSTLTLGHCGWTSLPQFLLPPVDSIWELLCDDCQQVRREG